MAVYQLKRTQKIPATLDELWDFMSSPMNLNEITPDNMGFTVTSGDLPEKMYPGMIITYKVAPFAGINMTWVTEITHVDDHKFFVDEQRVGPYTMWHHEHHLEEIEGGVEMHDIVTYQPPFGFLGAIAKSIYIGKKLDQIFDYRIEAIERKFGKWER